MKPNQLPFNSYKNPPYSLSAQDDFSKASLFNQYFYSAFSTSRLDLPDDVIIINSSIDNHLVSVSIAGDEVLEILNSFDPQKSTGIDGIGPKILKHCALSLYKPLYFLFTLSLRIPTDWPGTLTP